MSLTKRALVLFSVLILSGCETRPDPDAPRAPLPSEIKASSQPAAQSSNGMPSPKSLPEILKERAEKKAKHEAAEAAAKAAQDGAVSAPATETSCVP
jgi:hypothetical protein